MTGRFDWEGRKVLLDAPISAGFDLKDGDIAKGVTASVFFNSDLHAGGVLGCSEQCMLHGKCVPLTPNATADFGCLCECGWAGPDCR